MLPFWVIFLIIWFIFIHLLLDHILYSYNYQIPSISFYSFVTSIFVAWSTPASKSWPDLSWNKIRAKGSRVFLGGSPGPGMSFQDGCFNVADIACRKVSTNCKWRTVCLGLGSWQCKVTSKSHTTLLRFIQIGWFVPQSGVWNPAFSHQQFVCWFVGEHDFCWIPVLVWLSGSTTDNWHRFRCVDMEKGVSLKLKGSNPESDGGLMFEIP